MFGGEGGQILNRIKRNCCNFTRSIVKIRESEVYLWRMV